jgi:hypothetical protein
VLDLRQAIHDAGLVMPGQRIDIAFLDISTAEKGGVSYDKVEDMA